MSETIQKEILKYFTESGTKPLSTKELEEIFLAENKEEFTALIKALNELENTGQLVRTRKNRYGLPEKLNLIRGKIEMNKKGFAFLIPEEDEIGDIYIHSSDLQSAMNNDIVMVRLSKESSRNGRPEGEVIRVITRANNEIVGTFEESKGFGFVIPDDKRIINDIFIPKGQINGAVSGHKVIVHLTKYPEGRRRVRSAEGEIVEILGHKNDPGIDILSIIYKHGLRIEFPEEVIQQASNIPEQISDQDLQGRRDLREEEIVTIDGADAKDLDDAIRVQKLDNGNYLLGVYIADVSYYIKADSPMDKEAFERGNSVYLVDRVIPMIPHRLSNGICSLNKGEDRLVLGCEMEIDVAGKIVKHEIIEAVIRSTERMTYSDVNEILVNKDEALQEKYADLVGHFERMEQLAQVLRAKRSKRGAIDFDFDEAQIIVDDEGKAIDVVIRERSVGEKLIEEFMLAANETVAEHFHWVDLPFIHRIHEKPDEKKLQNFFNFLASLGLGIKGSTEDIHPLELQKVLAKVKGMQEEMIISRLMLRSMKQAKYDQKNVGHFGLSTDFYTHFTAPIRRYSDLTVHRLIRDYLIKGDMSNETIGKWKDTLSDIAKHTSETERTAIDTERDVDDLKKAEYMQDKIGEEFEGIISSVTNFGIFVELPNTIEGLIHVSYMFDDYYHFDERSYALIGEATGKVYRIGDQVKIKVFGVNLDEHTIDFVFAE